MKKFISAAAAFMLAFSALSVMGSADKVIERTARGIMAKAPVITVSLPKSMVFIFNPYEFKVTGKESVDKVSDYTSKVVCNYNSSDGNSWVIKNESDVVIKAGICAYTTSEYESFRVRDANVNTVDPEDETSKYLLLDIKASGGSSGNKNIILLNRQFMTDEGDESRAVKKRTNDMPDWWAEENDELITVIHDIPRNGEMNISLTGTTQNAGDLSWRKSDKAYVYFVFGFDPEPTTGS